jgi:hypothetical protein
VRTDHRNPQGSLDAFYRTSSTPDDNTTTAGKRVRTPALTPFVA